MEDEDNLDKEGRSEEDERGAPPVCENAVDAIERAFDTIEETLHLAIT